MAAGYVMVDCQSMNLLSQESQTINGLYAVCIDAIKTGKPIIAMNCTYGEGVPMTPISVMAIIEDGVVVFTASILQIRVASDDSVTIVPLIGNAAKAFTKEQKKTENEDVKEE